MSLRDHIKLSRVVWLFLLFFVVVMFSHSLYRHYNRTSARQLVMSSDMEGYYQYLPYTFFKEKDITRMRWARPYGEDKTLNVFTCGVAILQLPFFLVAHGVSELLEMEDRGYNTAYFSSVLFASIFYVFIGLYYLFKSLRRIFTKKTSFLTTLLVFMATNLFYYTAMQPGTSHAYSFFLLSLYIFFVPGFYQKPGIKSSLNLILPLALAVLIRPTNILAGLYFLFYGLASFRELRGRLAMLAGRWYLLLFMAFVAFLVFIPQMAYWHKVTGQWVVYSYTDSRFTNALTPQFHTVLIGPKNGWYLYTPLMLLATGGLLYLAFLRKLNAPVILLIMVLIIYINASWCMPTFSSAAGYRALIEWIPFMAIPLAFVIEYARERKGWKWALFSVLVLFVVYNILFSYKYNNDIWWNTEWQWSNFLRLIQF
ncbi:MAG: hypothetical protein K8R52_02530 [Bacteroidales bacterium]|nr:hypothetical protein [Bacteroidales bacterium]